MKPICRIFLPLILLVQAALPLPFGAMALAGEGSARKTARAAQPGASGLPTPRFVSLSASTVNMRAGPGVRYPITWVYRRAGVPLMVMAEYDYWRKVRDAEGTEGWMHRSLLSGRRTAVLRAGVGELRQEPKDRAQIILRAEAGVIGELFACQGAWCEMELNDVRAWLPRADIFGALPNEEFTK
ncbi:MAG: SH3 domain-containing protein [Alphaproteobacteria bacterium]|nr:SH3 domain-containing protein [Alphaproteobacteria bacterium]